jgi:hypothetical protein
VHDHVPSLLLTRNKGSVVILSTADVFELDVFYAKNKLEIFLQEKAVEATKQKIIPAYLMETICHTVNSDGVYTKLPSYTSFVSFENTNDRPVTVTHHRRWYGLSSVIT